MRLPAFASFAALSRLLAGVLLAATLASQATAASVTPLVEASWLKDHLRDPNVVVLDIRSALGGGAEAYKAGHIPGSVHSDYDKGGWRVTRNNVPFMLPTTAELEKLVGELGIDEDTHVVVVPAGTSFTDFGAAARVYWTLKVVGLTDVSILNGGINAWREANLPLEPGDSRPNPKIFTAKLNESVLAQVSEVEDIQANKSATLIDSRPATFFTGKEKAPAASAYGRIPGAVSLDSASFYDAKSNKLKSQAELAALAAAIPADKPAVAYCNTGHWASTDWFVLHEVLGRSQVRLYSGSMVEWTANPQRPLESSRTKWDDLKKALGLGS